MKHKIPRNFGFSLLSESNVQVLVVSTKYAKARDWLILPDVGGKAGARFPVKFFC